jgi:hypothetical protein
MATSATPIVDLAQQLERQLYRSDSTTDTETEKARLQMYVPPPFNTLKH